MPDKYDEAIAQLTAALPAHPKAIAYAWMDPDEAVGGCLFNFTGLNPKASTETGATGKSIGCLTMIRNRPDVYESFDEALTKEIIADERIPLAQLTIELEHLPVFAEYQRKLDALREKRKEHATKTTTSL
jgi:hypothetical protein